MIKSFKHKGLAELFERGRSRQMRHNLQSRFLRRLEALNQAESLIDLNVPGFNFHGLQGKPKRYSIHHVNSPWCITFEWEEGETLRFDLETVSSAGSSANKRFNSDRKTMPFFAFAQASFNVFLVYARLAFPAGDRGRSADIEK